MATVCKNTDQMQRMVNMRNMNKNMTEQRADSYFDLSLNEETSRYYFRVVALKYIIENPRKFGFYLESEDYYPALDDYKVVSLGRRDTPTKGSAYRPDESTHC